MTMTWKEKLADLDAWFASAPYAHTSALWDVLTALRGPDDANWLLKQQTTNHIRCVALPQTAARRRHWETSGERDWGKIENCVAAVDFTTSGPAVWPPHNHFGNHIIAAYRRLGITPPYAEDTPSASA